jgi:hypothetical protein
MNKTRITIIVALLVAAMTAPAFAGPRVRDGSESRCVTRPDNGNGHRTHSDRGWHRGWTRGHHRGDGNGGGTTTPSDPGTTDPSGPTKPTDPGTK